MDHEIEARCVGCRQYVSPPTQGVAYATNRLGSPYLTYACPKGHEVRWFIPWRPGRELPPPPGPAEAEARAQCFAEGLRKGLELGKCRLDRAARIMKAFGILGDFRIGLGVSDKTTRRMVERANAEFESNAGT